MTLTMRANLILEELVLNTFTHGAAGGLTAVELELDFSDETLTIRITDDGAPFNPLEDAPDPDLTLSLAERPIGGLGLHLVRSLGKDLEYRNKKRPQPPQTGRNCRVVRRASRPKIRALWQVGLARRASRPKIRALWRVGLVIAVLALVAPACRSGGSDPAASGSTPTPTPEPTLVDRKGIGVFDDRVIFGQSAAFSRSGSRTGHQHEAGHPGRLQ